MKFLLASGLAFFLFSCGNGNADAHGDSGLVTTGEIPRLAIYYPLDSTGADGQPVYHTIPAVQLIAQDGKPFSTSRVKGKVAVADFFFASCEGICPKMTHQLARVQQAFKGDTNVVLVSFTVDPDRDTAAFLQQYAMRFSADTAQWKFITGPKKELYDLARYGYFLAVEPGNGDSEDFIHSPQLTLTDKHARVRGYYDGTDAAAVDSLIVDMKKLLLEK